MKRVIDQKNVFISWTGADRELKNKIVKHLEENNITCIESDEECWGDFGEWSVEAVSKCSVFLLLMTENVFGKKWVDEEVRALQKLDNWVNRMIVICPTYEIYAKNPWGLEAVRASAHIYGDELDVGNLINKVGNALVDRQTEVYRQQICERSLRIPFYGSSRKIAAHQHSYDDFYINRSLTEVDEDGVQGEIITSPADFIDKEDVIFISGPAGIGKTEYIHQIFGCANKETLVISLSCSKVSKSSKELFDIMFSEFKSICGSYQYFSEKNFESILNARRLVLVLDGMDEIATSDRLDYFIGMVERFYEPNKSRTTLVFTSRNPDNANAIALGNKKTRRFILNKLTHDERVLLTERIFLSFGCRDKNNDFYIRAESLAEEIISNPLLVSQLATIYQKNGDIPKTVVGIYDEITQILKKLENLAMPGIDSDNNDRYIAMIRDDIDVILKAFAKKRYAELSADKDKSDGGGDNERRTKRLFYDVLKGIYPDDSNLKRRAEFLVEYLQNRSILIDGQFYHKMFLEYYTAVSYFDETFGEYGERIENTKPFIELFSHYGDAYWSEVIKLFLVKADSVVDEEGTRGLYMSIFLYGKIQDFTLLFDTCRDLIRHKEEAQIFLVKYLLLGSSLGSFPAYGPLFWYVPEYDLYEIALIALYELSDDGGVGYDKMAALVRDVCFIIGRKYTAESITDRVDGKELYDAISDNTYGIRRALCEMFFTARTDVIEEKTNIYPRCFNVEETSSLMKYGYGEPIGDATTLFHDELGLYSDVSYNLMNGEYIGLVSCEYSIGEIEQRLNEYPCRKLRGIILNPGSEVETIHRIAANLSSVECIYLPENICKLDNNWERSMSLHHSFSVPDLGCAPRWVDRRLILSDRSEELEDNTFVGCNAVESVIIPEGIKKIGDLAFGLCKNLKLVEFPDSLKEIDTTAFWHCHNLDSVNLPQGLRTIGNAAFSDCYSLTSISIPDSVSDIGGDAFMDCRSLSQLALGEGLTEIKSGAFSGCSSLASVNIPKRVNYIGDYAFFKCKSLVDINLPADLKKIDVGAFSGCSSLTSVTIPDGVEFICAEAFDGCSSLSELRLPEGIKVIEKYAFRDCTSLESVYIPEGVECDKLAFVGCPFAETVVDDSISDEGELVIPADKDKVDRYAYESCRSIKRLVVPSHVISIGEGAFIGCSELTDAEIYCKHVESDAFCNCTKLTRVSFSNNLLQILIAAFANTGLTTVDIPESVTLIAPAAFYGCKSLTRASISARLVYIVEKMFKNCTALTEVNLPDTVRAISREAFYGCSALEVINLPEGLDDIMDKAFYGCHSLKEINLPDCVTKIGLDAFKNCTSLKAVSIPANIRFVDDGAFEGCTSLARVVISKRFADRIDAIFGNIDRKIIEFI